MSEGPPLIASLGEVAVPSSKSQPSFLLILPFYLFIYNREHASGQGEMGEKMREMVGRKRESRRA